MKNVTVSRIYRLTLAVGIEMGPQAEDGRPHHGPVKPRRAVRLAGVLVLLSAAALIFFFLGRLSMLNQVRMAERQTIEAQRLAAEASTRAKMHRQQAEQLQEQLAQPAGGQPEPRTDENTRGSGAVLIYERHESEQRRQIDEGMQIDALQHRQKYKDNGSPLRLLEPIPEKPVLRR